MKYQFIWLILFFLGTVHLYSDSIPFSAVVCNYVPTNVDNWEFTKSDSIINGKREHRSLLKLEFNQHTLDNGKTIQTFSHITLGDVVWDRNFKRATYTTSDGKTVVCADSFWGTYRNRCRVNGLFVEAPDKAARKSCYYNDWENPNLPNPTRYLGSVVID